MKKVMLFIAIAIFVSCSNLNSKLENSLSKEIGKEPTKNEIVNEAKTQIILWEDVSLGKTDLLKNLTDKNFGSLPTKISDLEPYYDDNINPVEGAYTQYQTYENTESKLELSFSYFKDKPEVMNVRLYITTK